MKFVKMDEFGKDHWSLLMYIETRAVDYKGKLDLRHLRCNANTHPLMAVNGSQWEPNYGTRLKGSVQLEDHDDIDCLDDLDNAKLIEIISLVNGFVKMTNLGIKYAHAVRMHKIQGGQCFDFDYKKKKS